MLESFLFATHLEDEEVAVVIVHKHWLLGVKNVGLPSVSLLLSLATFTAAHTPAAFYVVAFWALASAIWFVREFLDYYMDAWIITNQGVIDLEWHGMFHRQSSRVLYSDVQGVSYETKGVLGTLLRYGSVSIEKISTGAAISLANVPNPRSVEATILRNMETYLHSKNMKDSKHVQALLAEIVTGQMQIKDLPTNIKPTVEVSVPGSSTASSTPKKKVFQSKRL